MMHTTCNEVKSASKWIPGPIQSITESNVKGRLGVVEPDPAVVGVLPRPAKHFAEEDGWWAPGSWPGKRPPCRPAFEVVRGFRRRDRWGHRAASRMGKR